MATFILNNTVVCVKADSIKYENEAVLALCGNKVSAVFKLSELLGCYLEEAML